MSEIQKAMESQDRAKRPHVIIIMADQLRYDVLGQGFTPHIDALRGESVVFEYAYCASPLCVPSRGAFFTGTYPNTNGSLINPWEPLDAHYGNVKTEIDHLYSLMEKGWDSLHSGKQHLYLEGEKLQDRTDNCTRFLSDEQSYRAHLKENNQPMPGGKGFRTKVPEMVNGAVTRVSSYSTAATGVYEPGGDYYFDGYFTAKALEGLKTRDRAKPLLLNLMLLAPHPPLQIPEPWFSRVHPEDVKLPDNVGVYGPRQSPLQMYNLPGIVGTRYTREEWAEPWRVYLGLVGLLDDCVGQVIAELKAQGIYEDCLIVFTSDHGEMLGAHALFQKMCMYEEAARVPLSIRFPKGAGIAPAHLQDTVSHIDVLPTLCEVLGLTPRHTMDGASLMPLVTGEGRAKRDVFIQYDGNGSRSNFQRCVVRGRVKLIVDLFKDEVFYELYDLAHDPGEMDNLIFGAGHDALATDLHAALDDHMRSTHDMLTLPALDLHGFRQRYAPLPAK